MLQIESTIDGISTRKDGSLGIRLSTQELSPQVKIELMEMVNQFGWFVFKNSETPIKEEDIPKYDPAKFDQIKSPATRMRAVLFKLWELKADPAIDFETYYRRQMELLIDKLKEKLN